MSGSSSAEKTRARSRTGLSVEGLRRNGAVLLCAGLLAGVVVADVARSSGRQESLVAYRDQEARLLSGAKGHELISTSGTNDLNRQLSGVAAGRKGADDRKAAELFGLAMTWDSYASYTNARNTVHRRYKMPYDAPLLKTFLPEVKVAADGSGRSYNIIDAYGYNMSYRGMTSTLTKLLVDKYSYFGLVTVNTDNKSTGGSVTSYEAVTYTVDGEGTISDVKIWPVSGQPDNLGESIS